MAFELKTGSEVFRDDFSSGDFEREGFHSRVIDIVLPGGRVKGTEWLFDGIKIIDTESEFKEPMELDWKGDTEMVTMQFNLQGKISVRKKSMKEAYAFSSNQHNMFYGKEAEGKIRVEELVSKSFLVQFSTKAFLNLVTGGNEAILDFAQKVKQGEPAAFSDQNLNIDLPLMNCINVIRNCTYADSLKRMFFYSKVMEMLVLQAESHDRAKNLRTPYIKKDYDKERILFARDYLLKNLDRPPGLSELAMIAGINEYKLKRGFKETFNQTVFEYLSDVRLELAKNDLLEKRKSISEIAFELGYSSLQHFSSAFKKKFGVTPREVK